jgi:hypothetical protein
MVRNTACEASDGCAAIVLERLAVDPWPTGQEKGITTLPPQLRRDRFPGDGSPLVYGGKASAGTGPYPVFEVGGWRFTVKTRDPRLIGDLEAFSREIAGHPRGDRKFTFRLIRSTEEGRLGGWAWQKERVQVI